jgi:hypothetical protein
VIPTTSHQEGGFFIAPYAPDGEFLDIGFWKYTQLSLPWIENCKAFIGTCRQTCKTTWEGLLERVETTLTSASGAGLATFYVDNVVDISCAFASGMNSDADLECIRLFVESLRRVDFVRQASLLAEPFESIKTIPNRPLTAVVVWPQPAITDGDHQILRELSTHFAAAFFMLATH